MKTSVWHGRANGDGDGLGGRGSVLLQPFALVPASVAWMPAVLLQLEAATVLPLQSSVSSKFSPVCPSSSGRRYWNRRWCWPSQPRPQPLSYSYTVARATASRAPRAARGGLGATAGWACMHWCKLPPGQNNDPAVTRKKGPDYFLREKDNWMGAMGYTMLWNELYDDIYWETKCNQQKSSLDVTFIRFL